MSNTKYAFATGGTPITTWLINQIEAVLKYEEDIINYVKNNSMDEDLLECYEHIDAEFLNFKHIYNDEDTINNLVVTYKSYSIYGHINDLNAILFKQAIYPWKDPKYNKRVIIITLLFLAFFIT